MSSRGSIRDRVIWFRDVASLRPRLVKLVSAIQDDPAQVQILAPALTFYCLAKAVGIDPHEVLQIIERMERDVDAAYANQFDAMQAYARGELN